MQVRKLLATLALSVLILFSGALGSSTFAATAHMGGQDRDWNQRRPDRDEQKQLRRAEREEMARIREQDRDRRLRYRYDNRVRTVGFFDREGNFHRYGYYDRWGFFHKD